MLNKILHISDTPTFASCFHYLDRVEVAVPIKWEADDMRWVMVPASIDRVAHNVTDFRKHIFNQGFVTAERDPFTQVRGHAHHQTLAGAQHPAELLVLAPALQLRKHGLQLEVSGLFEQQTVILQDMRHWHLRIQQKKCVIICHSNLNFEFLKTWWILHISLHVLLVIRLFNFTKCSNRSYYEYNLLLKSRLGASWWCTGLRHWPCNLSFPVSPVE